MSQNAPVRVMVVDDHPMWRDAVARDLAEAGYDVVATAADGGQALRIAGAPSRTWSSLTCSYRTCPGSR